MNEGIPRSIRSNETTNGAEQPQRLVEQAVFDVRGFIDKTKHSFQDHDGGVRVPKAWIEQHGSEDAARAVIERDLIAPFKRQKELLLDALLFVEYEELPALATQFPDLGTLERVGGAANYVAERVLDRTSQTIESVEQFDDLLHNFTVLFFNVSGWDYFVNKAQRRLSKK